jgi:hypothetical protein
MQRVYECLKTTYQILISDDLIFITQNADKVLSIALTFILKSVKKILKIKKKKKKLRLPGNVPVYTENIIDAQYSHCTKNSLQFVNDLFTGCLAKVGALR